MAANVFMGPSFITLFSHIPKRYVCGCHYLSYGWSDDAVSCVRSEVGSLVIWD